MMIIRNGSFRISPNNELHNNRLYKGKDNTISISRVYSADFECKFAMQYYPFDIQQCNMNFILEVVSSFYHLLPIQLRYCNFSISLIREPLAKMLNWLRELLTTLELLIFSSTILSVMK